MRESENSDFDLKADIVLLAMGFVHVEHGPLIKELGIELDTLQVEVLTVTDYQVVQGPFHGKGRTCIGLYIRPGPFQDMMIEQLARGSVQAVDNDPSIQKG